MSGGVTHPTITKEVISSMDEIILKCKDGILLTRLEWNDLVNLVRNQQRRDSFKSNDESINKIVHNYDRLRGLYRKARDLVESNQNNYAPQQYEQIKFQKKSNIKKREDLFDDEDSSE